jgi:hypothetical protein
MFAATQYDIGTMIIIQGKLVREDVLEEEFACHLEACKGACCWEGDWGAPLEDEELKVLEREYPNIRPFLSEEGQKAIDEHGPYAYYEEPKENGTLLLKNGACAFLSRDENGIARCGIERAFEAGATPFPKPVSCHLYPVRAAQDPQTGLEMLVYDRWDICAAACRKGQKEGVPLHQFVKNGLIRKYGAAWFEELEAAARHLAEKKASAQEER